MKQAGIWSIWLLSITLITSCVSQKMQKQLTYHNAQLTQLSERDIDPALKLDLLSALMVEALEESLQYNKPKNSVKFLKAYTRQNKKAIDVIYRDIEQWYTGLPPTTKLVETARLGTKPYVRQLINLVPKVEKKVNRKLKTIFFLSRFTGLLGL